MKRLFFILLISTATVTGCFSIARTRRIDYMNQHPELTMEQKDLLLHGRLWVGMTKEEVTASLGNPFIVQEDKLGEEEVWSYTYKAQYTTYWKYPFNRVLRLEFREGRLANWRGD